jgi:hypothetical protein
VAYRRPSFFVRKVFNPIAMRFGVGGVVTLAVRKRRSGETQRVPVSVLDHERARYLVSPRGETDWVKNLRAAGGDAELESGEGTERIRTVEVPVADRAPVLAAYQKLLGKAVAAHFKALPDPADHPAFRIEPR